MFLYVSSVLANFLLGGVVFYLAEKWLLRLQVARVQVPTVPEQTPDETKSNPPPPQSNWLAKLMEKVEGDLSRHAFEIDEFVEALSETSPDDPSSAVATAAAMLVANRRLQSDLALAHDEVQKQRQMLETLSAESRTDALTGLANRRSFDEELLRRFDQWRRHKVPVSLLLVDIDHFKQVNDVHGHASGDAALKWVANLHRETLRHMDVAARFGGEEFAIILPGTKLADAGNVAERVRAMIAARPFREKDREFPITVSVGAAMTTQGDAPETLIQRADEALYMAKGQGRNRAFLHNGTDAVAVQVDNGLVRHPFDTVQQVATYHGGTGIPAAHDFRPMRSSDISAKGISFITEAAPECKAFVVRLGAGKQIRHMVANIVNVTALKQQDATQYRIGCAFVARLESEDAALDDTTPYEAIERTALERELIPA